MLKALLALTLFCAACSDSGGTAKPSTVATVELPIEIGVPNDEAELNFRSFESGGEIPVASTFQGLNYARLAIRMPREYVFDADADAEPAEIVVDVELSVEGDSDAAGGNTPPPALNQTAGVVLKPTCHDDGFCYISPILVEVSMLAEELEGLKVRVQVVVSSPDDSLAAEAQVRGKLAPMVV